MGADERAVETEFLLAQGRVGRGKSLSRLPHGELPDPFVWDRLAFYRHSADGRDFQNVVGAFEFERVANISEVILP